MTNSLQTSLAGAALLLSLAQPVFAIQAHPGTYTEYQPDGSAITLRAKGDEHFNWTEDAAGYTVVRANNGRYEYALLKNGRLHPSGHAVGAASPAALGLQKHLLPSAAVRNASAKNIPQDGSQGSDSSIQQVGPSGNIKNLVVLIQFSDHTGRGVPTEADIDILMNAPGGDLTLAPTGSVRDVYLENSYGQMTLNSDVQPWVTVSNTEAYYANGQSGDSTLWEALREALDAVDATIDFRDYDTDNDGRIDAITFLHSGYGAEWGGSDAYGTSQANRIWSHRWAIQNPPWTSAEGVVVFDYHISPAVWGTSGSAIGRIGVIAHETGHFFGLPDLYDTNGGGEGIGSYGLMANSWAFDGQQLCPPHFSPWSKIELNWYTPLILSAPGEYDLLQAEQAIGTGLVQPLIYKIDEGYASGEYLLVENRQRDGFDCSMPQGGLAIWHIDEAAGYNTEGYPGQGRGRRAWPNNGRHYKVALLQADGDYDLERGNNRGDSGDVYHAGGVNSIGPGPDVHPNTDGYQGGNIVVTGHSLTEISAAGNLMTFCFNCDDTEPPPPPPPAGFNPPTELTASVTRTGNGKNASKDVVLNWVDNSDSEEAFVIERCEETGSKRDKQCNFSELATVGANITTYSDNSGLVGTWKYRVKARKSGAEDTAPSNEVKI